MKTFEELKSEFVAKCKAASACQPEFKKLLASKNEEELLQVVYNNLEWCFNSGVLSHEWFNSFNPEILLGSGCANTGKENTGFVNSGNWNSGYRNSGYRNSGDRNSGNCNSGDRNSGNCNSGDSNSGYRNSGNWNSGYRNSGDSNSGNSNSGNWNSGYRNSGDSNSGYRNSGAFCTDPNPKAILFNRESTLTVKEWENHPACKLMYSINPTIWIPMSIMNDAEKAAYPKYETTEGYLKTIPMKEAWANLWGNLTEENKKHFTTLPNFDPAIFEEITGVKI
jgi:hypothetical protein